VKVVASF